MNTIGSTFENAPPAVATSFFVTQPGDRMKRTEPPVCIVDDDVSVREAVSRLARSEGLRVETFATASELLAHIACDPPACLVLDVNLPNLNGLELQRELARSAYHVPIVFLTGKGSILTAMQAIKAGSIEFLTKPLDPEALLGAIHQGLASREYDINLQEDRTGFPTNETMGTSAAWRALLRQVAIVAPTESTVLLLGETGSGKELIAEHIHRCSRRKDRPLVRVNCASIPKDLYESEFFGHVKGAFTGALRDRAGRFEMAEGGTLFLDEIGEIPQDLQSKLLRALQEKQYERIGGDRTRDADVRIIAATNRDLKKGVETGHFREDLYYRLNVFPLRVPALRERREDIPLLAKHFADLAAKDVGCRKARLTEAGVFTLQNYNWPGNVRELRNIVERAVILARGGPLVFELPISAPLPLPMPAVKQNGQTGFAGYVTEAEMHCRERQNLLAVLDKTEWKISGADGAAELLGVHPNTLRSRIKKMGLKRDDEASPIG